MPTKQGEPADGASKLEVTEMQAAQLQLALALTKALASPLRLAIVGVLAAQLQDEPSVAELAAQLHAPLNQVARDVSQLINVGLVRVVAWTEQPGEEPAPAQVAFNPDYLKQLPQVISTLHNLHSQVRPVERKPVQDERTQIVNHYLQAGRLLSWPHQFKRQAYVIEAIAQSFAVGQQYSEAEVNAALKQIYPYDHATLRRYLVDLGFMSRANGIYQRTTQA